MNINRKKFKSILLFCLNLVIFFSSIVFAENSQTKNKTEHKTDVEKVISGYVGDKNSNQFKKNIKTLDTYYEKLNKKLNNEPRSSGSAEIKSKDNIKTKKSLLDRVDFGQSNNQEAEKNTETHANSNLTDEALIELMKQAGVDKNIEKTKENAENTSIKVFRDPFSLTPTLTGGGRIIEDSLPFAQKAFSEKMPSMVLKGVVVKPDGTRVALLQLDERITYMVKENDRVGLSALGLKMVIHIQEIHDNTIIVEPGEISTGQENEVIVVR